ncbi:MAG: hypothetical protein FJW23_15485 [Acidimicrobiia bacterium]|nr:hypothetical protein [Acidimicrobiia bacterium]
MTAGLRWTLFLLLIAAAAAAGYAVWLADGRAAAATARAGQVDGYIDSAMVDLSELVTVQFARVTPAQPQDQGATRTASLLSRIGEQASGLAGIGLSTAGATVLPEVTAGLASLMQVDQRVREYQADGDELMAADLAVSEGRLGVSAMMASLRKLREAERGHASAEARAAATQQAAVVGGAALVWLAGLLVLARPVRVEVAAPPKPSGAGEGDTPSASGSEPDYDLAPASEPVAKAAKPAAASAAPVVNLLEAAAVCRDLAQVTDPARLDAVLGKASAVLAARGMVIWLGAGEQLFPAASQGYDPRVLARLGPLDRREPNATTEAWTRAEVRTVAPEGGSNGAVVAPMISVDGCRGVLAVEVPPGRESDAASQAVVSMFASQLALIVGGWPSTSAPATPAPEPVADVEPASEQPEPAAGAN